MTDLRTQVDQLNQMILEGKILDAFEKFYSQEVIMQDNDYAGTEVKLLRKNSIIIINTLRSGVA